MLAAVERMDVDLDPDLELVTGAQSGDARAMEQLYRRHGAAIHAYLLRSTGDRAAAEEIAQETFIRAFRAIGRFDRRSRFRTWLFAIAINRSRTWDASRRNRARHEAPREDTPAIREAASNDREDRDVWARRRLERALGELPEGYRAVVIMHDVLEMEHQEIAAARGCTVGTSKSQLHKARARLRELLGGGSDA